MSGMNRDEFFGERIESGPAVIGIVCKRWASRSRREV
jgi:hypothetical protein